MKLPGTSLGDLPRLRAYQRRRLSSYDPTGGNADYWDFAPGQTRTIAAIQGAGCIKHIWMTMASQAPAFARQIVLRLWWDGEAHPSVEVPIGDFFG
ncbi:MAG: DUF2961 domain-containing protein, partial [Chloroflexi bacterium]|nr:DUF2961 domain-containing protein [Chloroflexota bacterium]